jgi:hypothetical protein
MLMPRWIGSYPRVYVFNPSNGLVWITGQTRNIIWRLASLPPPPTPPTVTITLKRRFDKSFRYLIADNVTTTSLQYTWAIPSDVPAHDDYYVKILPRRPFPGHPNIMASNSKGNFTIVPLAPTRKSNVFVVCVLI